MKLSSIVSASVFALAAAAFVAGGASAATTINTSKSNTFKIGTEAGTTEADCTKNKGAVTTDNDGVKWCTSGSSTKTKCLIYKPGHEGDDRYCSQSVPQ